MQGARSGESASSTQASMQCIQRLTWAWVSIYGQQRQAAIAVCVHLCNVLATHLPVHHSLTCVGVHALRAHSAVGEVKTSWGSQGQRDAWNLHSCGIPPNATLTNLAPNTSLCGSFKGDVSFFIASAYLMPQHAGSVQHDWGGASCTHTCFPGVTRDLGLASYPQRAGPQKGGTFCSPTNGDLTFFN